MQAFNIFFLAEGILGIEPMAFALSYILSPFLFCYKDLLSHSVAQGGLVLSIVLPQPPRVFSGRLSLVLLLLDEHFLMKSGAHSLT